MTDELKQMIINFVPAQGSIELYNSFEFHTSLGSQTVLAKDLIEMQKKLKNSLSVQNDIKDILKGE